jgi:hypothetical protein
MRLLTITLTSALLLAACSDDTTNPPAGDKTVAQSDKGTPALDRATTAADKGTSEARTSEAGAGQTCKQVAECAMPCGTDLTVCVAACKDKGCPDAVVKFDALAGCAILKCIADCTGGFNEKCNTCAQSKCPTEYNACQSHTC